MEVGDYLYKYTPNIVKLYVMANLIATFGGYRAAECRLGCTGAGTVHGGTLDLFNSLPPGASSSS